MGHKAAQLEPRASQVLQYPVITVTSQLQQPQLSKDKATKGSDSLGKEPRSWYQTSKSDQPRVDKEEEKPRTSGEAVKKYLLNKASGSAAEFGTIIRFPFLLASENIAICHSETL